MICLIGVAFITASVHAARDEVVTPKEYGVYVKTGKQTKRILPNIVFEDNQVLYVESNNPVSLTLKDIEYFIIYGNYETDYLTLNPLLFFQQSPIGKSRFILGRDIELDVTKKSDLLHVVKPKNVFGRGYYALWINDSVWDFIIE